MANWSESDFQRAAKRTRLADDTLAACHDVLVNDAAGVEAAEKFSVSPPQISRGLKILREKHAELLQADLSKVESLRAIARGDEIPQELHSVLKEVACEAARSIKGEEWIIRNAVPGQIYEGNGVVKTGGFLVQDVGRVGVVHDLKLLDENPDLGQRLEIVYGMDGRGAVRGINLGLGTRERER